MELLVVAIVPGSTAERLGIARNDRLLTYNGVTLTAVEQFIALVTDETSPAIRILVIGRGSKIQSLNVPKAPAKAGAVQPEKDRPG